MHSQTKCTAFSFSFVFCVTMLSLTCLGRNQLVLVFFIFKKKNRIRNNLHKNHSCRCIVSIGKCIFRKNKKSLHLFFYISWMKLETSKNINIYYSHIVSCSQFYQSRIVSNILYRQTAFSTAGQSSYFHAGRNIEFEWIE